MASIIAPPYSFFIAERPEGFVVRYEGACECILDAAGTRMEVLMDERVSVEYVGMLISGGAVSFAAMLQGAEMFHASAALINGSAVLAIGPSGAGKSTTAAELCLAGGRLLTDDAVRVRSESGGVVAFRGARELRLRSVVADTLQNSHPHIERVLTPDGRSAVRFPLAPEQAPVVGVLVPEMIADTVECRFDRLSEREAVIEAVRNPRVGGLVDQGILKTHFKSSADLAAKVPFFRLIRSPEPVDPDLLTAGLTSALE